MPYRLPLTWIRIGSATLIAATVVAAVVLFRHGQDASRDLDQAVQLELHTHDVLLGGMRLRSALQDAETGQRGYLLTSREAYLEPFNAGKAEVEAELARLSALVRAPQLRDKLKEIRALAEGKLAELEETIARFKDGDRAGAVAVVENGRGKALMDEARAKIADFIAEANRLLEERQRLARDAAERHQGYLTALAIFEGLLIVGAAAALIYGIHNLASARLVQALQKAREAERQGREDIQTILDITPAAVWIGTDPACTHVTTNRMGSEILGLARPANASKSAPTGEAPSNFDVVKEGRVLAPEELPLQRAAATGKPFHEQELELRFVSGETKYLFGNATPLFDKAGRVRGAVAAFLDITRLKRQEAEIAKLVGEVNHRAKNILMLVQAIARQTPVTSREEFLRRFEERIAALAASQNLLVKNEWVGTDLRHLIESQLAHFKDVIGTRIALSGPPLRITSRAAQAIGMALHELSTNAGKYGSLSTESGRIEISWKLVSAEKESGADLFEMVWRESGGPPVKVPERRGFGSTVICNLTESTFGGRVTLDFPATGLVWQLRCPARDVIDTTGLHTEPVAVAP